MGKKRPNYDGPITYKGKDDGCFLCGGEKLLWREAMLCVECDNDEHLSATWFTNFAESEGK
jgi:hypothetical protein